MSPTGDTRKRQRVSQACHRCRSRKYRCDGARPRCSACVAVDSTECIYEAGSKRRGLTSGYVRALESLWALAFERIPGSKAGVQDLLSHLSATINDVTPQSRAEREEELSRVWRSSGVPSAIESVLTGRPIEAVHEDSQNPTAETSISWALPAAYVPTSPAASNDFTFTDTEVHLPPSPISSALPLPIPAPSTAAVQQRPASPIFDPSSSGKHSRKLVPLPDDWLELVQVYLAAEHTWLPVLQRSALFRAASSYQDHVDACLQPSDSDKAEFSCLWAVLILGEIHAHTASSPRLPVFRRMSQSCVEDVDLFNEGDMLAYPLRYALVYILWTVTYMGQKKLFRAKLTLVRAMVLATLDDSSTAGMVSGAWPSRPIVSAACFVLDTILSLGMSSKPMLTNSDLQVESRPLNEESPDEWEPFVPPNIQSQEHDDANNSTRRAIPNRTCSTFNSLVEILRTLNDLLHSNGGLPRNSGRLPVEPSLEEAQSHLSLARQSPAQLHLRLVQLVLYDTSMPAGTPVSTAASNNAASKPLREQLVALLAHMKSHVGTRLLPASLSALIPRGMTTSSRLYTVATKPPIRGLFEDLDNVWLSDNTTTPGLTCGPLGATGSQTLPDRYEHQDMLSTPAGVSASFAGGQTDPLEDGPSVGRLGSRTGAVDSSAGNVTFEMQDPRLPADRSCSTEQILETLHMPTSHDDADDSFVQVDPFHDYIALVDSNENSSSADFLASLGFLSEESFAGA